MRSAAVLRAPSITTDCSATTWRAVVTNPVATCIAADFIAGSDVILIASACTAAARSSSDFWSSGDGLKETESAARFVDLDGVDLIVGCCDRAAEVTAIPVTRTSKRAIRFIGRI